MISFLSACGFETANIDEQEFWIYPASTIESDPQMSVLYCLRDAIEAAEPIKAELDRGLRILLPSQVSKRVELPPDFFNISPEEIKKEQRAREHFLSMRNFALLLNSSPRLWSS